MRSRIMYIENKGSGLSGPARIGRLSFSKSGTSVYYQGRRLEKTRGYKYNYVDAETGDEFWVSGCKKNGGDRLYPGLIQIDADVREEYWKKIRNKPDQIEQATIRCIGKYGH